MIGRWWPIIFYSRMSVYRTHSDGSKNDCPQIVRFIFYKLIRVGQPIFVSNPKGVRIGKNVEGLNWVGVVTILFLCPISKIGKANPWPIIFASVGVSPIYRQSWVKNDWPLMANHFCFRRSESYIPTILSKNWLATDGQSLFTRECRYIGLTPTELKMIVHRLASLGYTVSN